MSSTIEDGAARHGRFQRERTVRNIRDVARRLRDLADRIDRAADDAERAPAKRTDAGPVPPRMAPFATDVAHQLAWGFANLNLSNVLDAASDADYMASLTPEPTP